MINFRFFGEEKWFDYICFLSSKCIGVIYTEYLKEYQLKITFDNNISKVVDLANFLNGEIFEPIKDINYFKQVKVDE